MAAVEIIEIKGDASQAIAALKAVGIEADKTQTKAKETNEAISSGLEALDKRTGGAVSAFKSLQSGIGGAIKSFGTLKGAIIATGLGALLVAVTSLVSYFSKTERGGDALAVVLGALGAVVGKLTDLLVKLGEKLFEAFQNPQQALKDFGKLLKENITNRIEGLLELLPALGKAIGLALKGEFSAAAKTAADAAGKVALGVEDITDKVGAAVDATVEFSKSLVAAAKEGARVADLLNAVEDAERALIVQRAKANKQIAEARFIADDLTKSTEERIAAVKRAGALEEEVASKEIANQKLRLQALKAQSKISEVNEEQLVAIAEAEARVSELEQASIARRRRLGTEVKSLLAEKLSAEKEINELIAANQEAAIKDEAERENVRFANIQNRLSNERNQAISAAEGNAELIASINKKYDALDVQATQAHDTTIEALNKTKNDKLLSQNKQAADINRNLIEDEQVRAIANLQAAFDAEYLLAEGNAELRLALQNKFNADVAKVNDDAAKKELDKERQRKESLRDFTIDSALQTLSALKELNGIFDANNKDAAQKAFNRNKALSVAETLISTYLSAQKAYASQLTLTPDSPIRAAIAAAVAVAGGLARVAAISAQKFDAGSPSPSVSTSAGGSIPTAPSQPPQFNVVGQGGVNQLAQSIGGQFNQPIRAYVVGGDVTTSQQLQRQRVRTATFG